MFRGLILLTVLGRVYRSSFYLLPVRRGRDEHPTRRCDQWLSESWRRANSPANVRTSDRLFLATNASANGSAARTCCRYCMLQLRPVFYATDQSSRSILTHYSFCVLLVPLPPTAITAPVSTRIEILCFVVRVLIAFSARYRCNLQAWVAWQVRIR